MYIITDVRIANDDGLVSNLLERLSNRSFTGIKEINDIITGLDYTFHFTLVEDYKICEISDNKTCLATFRLVEGKLHPYERIEKFFVQCLLDMVDRSDKNDLYELVTAAKSKELAKKYCDYLYQIVENFELANFFVDKEQLTLRFDERGYYYYS